jgi:hypothetical protein
MEYGVGDFNLRNHRMAFCRDRVAVRALFRKPRLHEFLPRRERPS